MKEFDPRLAGSVFMLPSKDSGDTPNLASEAEKSPDIPTVLHDKQDVDHVNRRAESTKDNKLKIKPIFSPKELVVIHERWEQESVCTDEQRKRLEDEELRLQALCKSDKALELINIYQRILPKAYQGLSRSFITSPDEIIILLRHAIPLLTLQPGEEPLNQQQFRERVRGMEDRDLEKVKLGEAVETQYPSHQEALIAAYPTLNLQPFEFKRTQRSYWTGEDGKENCREAVRYVVETCLGIKKQDPEKFRSVLTFLSLLEIFNKFGLAKGFRAAGYRRLSQVVIDTYPELKLNEWEFKKGVIWQDEEGENMAKAAVKWLIEQRLGLKPEDPVFRKKVALVTADHFKKCNLGGLLRNHKTHSHLALIRETYSDLSLGENEFYRFPAGFWQTADAREKAINIIRDLIENKLGLNSQDANFRNRVIAIQGRDFEEVGLGGMISTLFQSSAITALVAAYPELNIREWELSRVSKNFWGDSENIKKAVRWLIEEKFRISPSDPNFKTLLLGITKSQIGRLESMLIRTNLTFFEAIKSTYPDMGLTQESYLKAMRGRRSRKIKVGKESIPSQETKEELGDLEDDEKPKLRQENAKIQTVEAPEGWVMWKDLARILGKGFIYIKRMAEKLGGENAECFKLFSCSEGLRIHYSPELIEKIKRKIEEENKNRNQKELVAPDKINEDFVRRWGLESEEES